MRSPCSRFSIWNGPENFFDSEELAMHHERGGVAHVQTKLLSPV